MNTNFWQGEKTRLCAVEEDDTELDRYEDLIRFPSTKEQGREFFKKVAERDGKGDQFFWLKT